MIRGWRVWYGEWDATRSTPPLPVVRSSSFSTCWSCLSSLSLLWSFRSVNVKLWDQTDQSYVEWSHHEHVDGLQFKSVNYQETSQVHLTTFISEKTIWYLLNQLINKTSKDGSSINFPFYYLNNLVMFTSRL